MEPVTLTTDRLLLRTVGPQDTDTVYRICQDPDIQRWTTIPSPYLPEHARFHGAARSDGWANGTMFTFGVFLPAGELTGMLGVTMRSFATGEVGFWSAKEHRGNGYITEATVAACRWAFTRMSVDRMEWRAEVGNTASRAVAERAASGSRACCAPRSSTRGCCGTAGWAPCSPPTWAFRPPLRTCPPAADVRVARAPAVVSGAL